MTRECAWLVQAETPGIYVVLVIASAVDSETGATVTAQGTAKEGVPHGKLSEGEEEEEAEE